LLSARVIEIFALAVRHVLVGLLDAREHLFVERLLETGGRFHHRLGVIGLGLEISQDVFVGLSLVSHPPVFVRNRIAMDLRGLRDFFGDWRFWWLFLSKHLNSIQYDKRRQRGGRQQNRWFEFHDSSALTKFFGIKQAGRDQVCDFSAKPEAR